MRILAMVLIPSLAFVAWAIARTLNRDWVPYLVLAILLGAIYTMIALAIG